MILADAGAKSTAVAGGIVGAAVTVGVSFAVNTINNSTEAYIVGSTVTSSGDVILNAESTASIWSMTMAFALSASVGGLGLSGTAVGSQSDNQISNTVSAYIANDTVTGTASSVTTTNGASVLMTARDKSAITADAGGYGVAASVGAFTGAGAYAASAATNDITNTVQSYIQGSSLTADGNIELTAHSVATINALTMSGATTVSASVTGVGGAGSSSEAINNITNTIDAYIDDDGSAARQIRTSSGGVIKLTAEDNSTIIANAVSTSLSFGFGLATGNAAVGAAVGNNVINNSIKAYISGATIDSDGSVELFASSIAFIDSNTIAASVSVTGGLAGASFSGGGATSENIISNIVEAKVDGNSTIIADGSVSISALDAATITADVGSTAFAVGLTAGASVGISTARNKINNQVRAYADQAAITSTQNGIAIE